MNMTGTEQTQEPPHNHRHDHDRPWELYLAIGAGIAYATGLVLEYALHIPHPWPVVFYLITYALGGWNTAREALDSIRHKRFEVDFLMLLAAIGAAAVGLFAEGAVLLFLFSLGHALQEYALTRATRSIESLGELTPRTAYVVGTFASSLSSWAQSQDLATSLEHESTPPKAPVPIEINEYRAVEDLRPGDILAVPPDSRIPADGFLITGTTAVDQSPITGESIPVEKSAVLNPLTALENSHQIPSSATVFAGTINGTGAIEVVVTKAQADSTLARVIALVQDAETVQSPTQSTIKRIERIYVPIVVFAIIAVCVIGIMLAQSIAESFSRAMVVLVAASPCALAVATPAAILAAISRAARAGVLIKTGAALEILGQVHTMAFDKTGTLTWGQPQISEILPTQGTTRHTFIETVWAVESKSDHPLAHALVAGLAEEVRQDQVPQTQAAEGSDPTIELARSQAAVPIESSLRIPQAMQVESVAGKGVCGLLDGDEVLIGTTQLMEDSAIEIPEDVLATLATLQGQGRTTMVVARAGIVLGIIGLMDTPRRESAQTLDVLRQEGVRELVLLSGDNQQVANSVGQMVGATRVLGSLLPHHKAEVIETLSGPTCMVGDGVNDAPAMARAHLGIAMGAAGSTVALETAEIALMSDDLGRVPFTRRLSQATTRIIRQNLIGAMAVVALLIPLALLNVHIGPIVFIHEGSTILVILNSLRLLRFEINSEHRGIDHEDRPS